MLKKFNKNFILLILGQILSLFAASVLRFALSLYVLEITKSAQIFANILAISTVPSIILSPIGGSIADRFNRKNLMVIIDATSSIVVISLIISFYSSAPHILLIGLIMTLLATVGIIDQPTVQACIPSLIEHENLMYANSVVSGIGAITNLAGPIIGGVLYKLGINTVVIISFCSFFSAAIIELFIKMPFERPKIKTPILNDMAVGIKHIIRTSFLIKFTVIAFLISFLSTPVFTISIPYIIKITMGVNGVFFGIALGLISSTAIIASVTIGFFKNKIRLKNAHITLLICGILLFAMSIFIIPQMLNFSVVLSYIMFVILGMLIIYVITILSIFIITIIQKNVKNNLLGKIMAILIAVNAAAVPLGQIVYGRLIDAISQDVYLVMIIGGTCLISTAYLAKYLLKSENDMSF